MRIVLPVVALALSGCSARLFGLDPIPPFAFDAGGQDGADDIDAFPCTTFIAANVDTCATPTHTGTWNVLTDVSINTDALTATDGTPIHRAAQHQGNLDVAVIEVETLFLESGHIIQVSGSRPLVIIVHQDAKLDGAIDVAPAPNAPPCVDGGDGVQGSGGGGSGGGGYGAAGAGGGKPPGGVSGGGGQRVVDDGTLLPLRFGCAGGKNAQTVGGGAGGALQLSVAGILHFSGVVTAGGGGGAEGSSGGAGGGAGGAILVEASQIVVDPSSGDGTPRLCANGGAGGNGGTDPFSGSRGTCGPTVTQAPAMGGGISGGAGGAENLPAVGGANGGIPGAASGGGGGGVGRIMVRSTVSGTILSTPTYVPL